jgi:hypothetical protein
MDTRDLDLRDLSDVQLSTLVQALHDDDDEPTELLRCLERELARRARRGTLQ